MHIYKFGGASIATAERMQALKPIVEKCTSPLVIVVSAIGKTTNSLEAVVKASFNNNKEQAHLLAKAIETEHLNYCKQILNEANYQEATLTLGEFFTELQWAIDDADTKNYDYTYDQIVSIGELLSTRILSLYLKQEGFNNEWVDIRDVIRTDETYRDAVVNQQYSEDKARQVIGGLLKKGMNVITQGFIGATINNATVTLGRGRK